MDVFAMEEIGEDDDVYQYDADGQAALRVAKPWADDVFYFKKVRISAVALLKIALHAHGGATGRKAGARVASLVAGSSAAQPEVDDDENSQQKFEVMGFLQGKIVDNEFVIMDSAQVDAAFSESSVELDASALSQKLASFTLSQGGDKVYSGHLGGRKDLENPALGKGVVCDVPKDPIARPEAEVGWYHTHPGLTLFFSNTDVINQRNMQEFQDPYIALVFEPVQMVELGRCRIGAFRVFPKGYNGRRHDDAAFETQAAWSNDPGLFAPLPEIDLRAGDSLYYRLEVDIFKSKLDNGIISKLFQESWGHALAASGDVDSHTKLVRMQALARDTEKVEEQLSSVGGRGMMAGFGGDGGGKGSSELQKVSTHAVQAAQSSIKGMMSAVSKDILFNQMCH